ncbi:phospholipase effector Tle1 domain-containing protein [Streptomyces galilaeus]|uniref:phospholipase effector Tle1 domain-containing protein n=1 Tax=Streptomyces galilaeus TaxID=33899 RepID=UPI0019B87ECC|nr:DUF2235 domain-containing protein [Streptomyces galilaeus]GGW78843.1 hypothetical protein GCM10010350_74770 [Streptomyces galilaeus]
MAKRLVVCCDGTWNFADQPSKTNVAKVALSVRPGSEAGKEQRVYFDPRPGWDRIIDDHIGWSWLRTRHALTDLELDLVLMALAPRWTSATSGSTAISKTT